MQCELIAPIYHCEYNLYLDRPELEGKRVFFYDTVAETIKPDPTGKIEELTWHAKREGCGEQKGLIQTILNMRYSVNVCIPRTSTN